MITLIGRVPLAGMLRIALHLLAKVALKDGGEAEKKADKARKDVHSFFMMAVRPPPHHPHLKVED